MGAIGHFACKYFTSLFLFISDRALRFPIGTNLKAWTVGYSKLLIGVA